ncbi:hypothetical protein G9A89_004141 [Geosiphon pyriformis]|nr:hypothetical protein G9A89_004141 [Geosiphon pyriformis]
MYLRSLKVKPVRGISQHRKLTITHFTTLASNTNFPTSSSPSASIPFMITSTSRQKLYELEYTKTEVDSLSPSQALFILEHNFTPESYGAYVRATYQPKKTPEVEFELPPVIQLGSGDTCGDSIKAIPTQC